MRRILITLSLLGVLSCKTSNNRSRLDSAVWMEGDLAKLIYFENNTFVVNSCPAPQGGELREILKNSRDLEKAKKVCNQFSTPVSSSALKTALTEAILGPADSKLGATKAQRIIDIPNQILDLKQQLSNQEATLNTFDESLMDILAPDVLAKINLIKTDIANLDKESKQLEGAKNDPEKLKAIDINTTLALQSKIASTAVDQASVFIAMLRDVKLYTLDMNRDTTLVTALSIFAPTCSYGMTVGEKKTVDRGAERLEVFCEKNGSLTLLNTTCTMPGYELKTLAGQPKSCVFTGKNLQLDTLVATHDGICGLNQQAELSCWGKVGRFPLTIDLSSVPNSTNKQADILNSLVSSAQQLCVFNRQGNVNKCWPFQVQPPEKSTSFKAVTGGETHMCGISSSQDVKCWGQNDFHQLDIPSGISGVKMLSTLENVSCVVNGDNKLKCWGEQIDKQGFEPSTIPSVIDKANAVSVGPRHICALDTNNKVSCWGEQVDAKFVPSDLPSAVFVAAGRYESCAITTEGDLRCWGKGPAGRAYRTAPPLKNVKNIIVSRWGANFCAIYDTDKKLSCWGSEIYNEAYKFEAPSDLKGVKTVAITTSGYACALTDNGQLRCFGNTSDIPNGPTKL